MRYNNYISYINGFLFCYNKQQGGFTMKAKLRLSLLVVLSIIFICSLSYIVYNKYKMKMEENRLEELQQNIVENPESEKVDIVEEQPKDVLETEEPQTELQEEKEPEILPQYEELYQENQDLIGWIKIDDTPIDYPVMQTFDNPTFYIHRDWDKNESKSGLPLIDARCTLESENIIIYSHRMKNGTMFGSLKNYNEKSFYDEHQIIKFDTIYEEAEYQIIAVLLAQAFYDEDYSEDEFVYYNYIELDSEERFQEYIDWVKELSLYDTGVTAEYGDSLITLCTCNYHVQDGRLLVVAKKIQ